MSEEGKFWFGIAALATVAFTSLVAGCVINAIHEDNAISTAIRAGENPMDAYCAYDGGGDHPDAVCVIRAGK
ncbi:hypothetical protein I5421_05930 [Citrobacter braakii]|nr:hypothetical protein [Citrobacter braakii]MBJ8901131.1 hypothetical protein [Citrobacter braakii]MBJ8905786.1 hypothetical protein [Citrobacter braakii]MBJ8919358.1 hypothetical protein [Citrobacter braakii]